MTQADGPALEAREIRKQFGGVVALDGASLRVARGEILGLIGPNGAGKSTFFDVLTGVQQPDSGTVHLFGEDVTGAPPHVLARRGLTRTFQLARELDRLSVVENLVLAAPDQPGENLLAALLRPARVGAAEARAIRRADEVLEIVGLQEHRHALAQALSGGQKKLLELARSLMTEAPLILLDEVGAGVAPARLDALIGVIGRMNRDLGRTLVIVEHNMGLIGRLCHRVVVLAAGRPIAEGSFDAVCRDPDVMESYLGLAA
jgi:branched-chain amino acid transport system ATP-binding protein/neutral amino acid transport system ATP-binding protein